jgi:plastocyanin
MIQNFLFAPEGLTVAPGATVTVVNQDTANHTLTEKDHSFDTGNIPGNATGTFTAPTKAGTYPYICAIHPFMTGTLTVS